MLHFLKSTLCFRRVNITRSRYFSCQFFVLIDSFAPVSFLKKARWTSRYTRKKVLNETLSVQNISPQLPPSSHPFKVLLSDYIFLIFLLSLHLCPFYCAIQAQQNRRSGQETKIKQTFLVIAIG